jgi:chorismate mutase
MYAHDVLREKEATEEEELTNTTLIICPDCNGEFECHDVRTSLTGDLICINCMEEME